MHPTKVSSSQPKPCLCLSSKTAVWCCAHWIAAAFHQPRLSLRQQSRPATCMHCSSADWAVSMAKGDGHLLTCKVTCNLTTNKSHHVCTCSLASIPNPQVPGHGVLQDGPLHSIQRHSPDEMAQLKRGAATYLSLKRASRMSMHAAASRLPCTVMRTISAPASTHFFTCSTVALTSRVSAATQ